MDNLEVARKVVLMQSLSDLSFLGLFLLDSSLLTIPYPQGLHASFE